jgi:hypothetical protein
MAALVVFIVITFWLLSPRKARWKVTQRKTTSRLHSVMGVTLKGSYFDPGRTPEDGERKLNLWQYIALKSHFDATK